ncbi:transcription termination factor MTERF9, chloroplastic isoform X1 [Vigna radiata var. radiata]|uniref:Transcription termination factor MTERF9, chloroplastic isoform X1 n=1 Tax=Vigna radiata var. radiata TaxID=3916 RepID=A0A1S3UH37_VIGRR|nr:transcription termination factor MTERF9, chloroplastic isoform X1 [Vigna radiata var. radiata]XP_014505347.1 transcription termination factor MTERF9, chloroplastic isoform X1 [Vigna radiata var. radiata]
MAASVSLYPYKPLLYFSTPSCFQSQFRNLDRGHLDSARLKGIVKLAAHSNPKILKTNRKSKYGEALSFYDSDEDDEETDEEEDDEDDDDWLSDEEFAEPAKFDVRNKRLKSKTVKGKDKEQEWEWGLRSLDNEHSIRLPRSERVASLQRNENGKVPNGDSVSRNVKNKKYPRLSDEIPLDLKWLPLLDYLSTFGMKESHFIQIYERHMQALQINVGSAQERLEYLMSVGVKHRDVRRILLRQPQILEYTVENNLKSRVAFLRGLGIPNSRMGQIIAAAPSLFSYSVENSLKPTVRYLVEEVGIKEKDLGKVIQLSPQILVQRIDISWNMRYMFLTKELGAPRDSIVKMVTKHPQLLHYSIDDGLLPRINFLRSIGMKNSDILKVLTSLTQVLSLSLEENLKPKYLYLVNELNNEVQSLTKYPMYLSLSLDQRIRPRHRFLVSLKKAPKGPFPLGSLVPTDECFCEQWAGTSLDKYLAFRQRLLLQKFAEKYERKM